MNKDYRERFSIIGLQLLGIITLIIFYIILLILSIPAMIISLLTDEKGFLKIADAIHRAIDFMNEKTKP